MKALFVLTAPLYVVGIVSIMFDRVALGLIDIGVAVVLTVLLGVDARRRRGVQA